MLIRHLYIFIEEKSAQVLLPIFELDFFVVVSLHELSFFSVQSIL